MNHDRKPSGDRLITTLDRVSCYSFIAFMAGLALCSAITGGHSDYPVIYNTAFACTLVFELALICALAIRGLIRFKQFGWQFSIRTLLIVTTLAAIGLGFTMYVARK